MSDPASPLPRSLSCPPHDFLDLCARAHRGEFHIWQWEAKIWFETGKKTARGKLERYSRDGWTAHLSWPQDRPEPDGAPDPETCGPLCVCVKPGARAFGSRPSRPLPATSGQQNFLKL